ncbi:MAG TPA: anion permease, partial [Gemmatimonadaceae bacterium]|nr:anion permease [Gemmatimonadaceae bacterium]
MLGRDALGPTTLQCPRAQGAEGVEMLGHEPKGAPRTRRGPTADRPRDGPWMAGVSPGCAASPRGPNRPSSRRAARRSPWAGPRRADAAPAPWGRQREAIGGSGLRYPSTLSTPDERAGRAVGSQSPAPRSSIENVTLFLVAVVILAIAFDYINGFHDTANAIATSVATRALRPEYALLMAAAFNFIGAFAGTAVAKTIGAGLVDEQTTTQVVVAAALIGAITWNLITWWLGLPSSSSHALIGGLIGATIIASGLGALKWDGIVNKVLIPLFSSPVIGFIGALVLMVALSWIFRGFARRPLGSVFRRLQVLSAGSMAFAHGSNDAQKTMGIITLALFAAGAIPSIDVAFWVIVVSASAISL